MIAFEPSEEQALMRASVADFARAALVPRVREFERLRALPDDVLRSASEMGLGLLGVPESAGGQGLGMVTSVLLEEELGAADAAVAFALPGPHAFATAIVELGTEEQARAELEAFTGPDAHTRFGAVAWSEPAPNRERAGFSTTATRDGDAWILEGTKSFVTNAALADRFVVFAQIEPALGWGGLGAFIVRASDAGFTAGARHDTLGLDAADFGAISLQGVRVPDFARLGAPRDPDGDGFTRATLRYFARHALIIAARAVGVARSAYELARDYCDTRTAFGKRIGHFQAVAFTLADRLIDLESARWLVWRGAHAWDALADQGHAKRADAERLALKASAQAGAHALEVAMRAADDCVSLHGGSGFIRDLIAEKLMRDAKQLALSGPTPEHLDQLATAIDLGLPLDPALLLPTPDAQAIFT